MLGALTYSFAEVNNVKEIEVGRIAQRRRGQVQSMEGATTETPDKERVYSTLKKRDMLCSRAKP